MMCLPEEAELVGFGEDHEGLPLPSYSVPQKTPTSESQTTLKGPTFIHNANNAQRNFKQTKMSPDMSAHFSSSPSPPTMTASSASSAVSSLASSAMKSKPPTGKNEVLCLTFLNKNHFILRNILY